MQPDHAVRNIVQRSRTPKSSEPAPVRLDNASNKDASIVFLARSKAGLIGAISVSGDDSASADFRARKDYSETYQVPSGITTET
jgi:hypothetical protein